MPLGGLFAGPLPLPVSEVAAECCTALVAGKDAERATDAAGGVLADPDSERLPRDAGEDASDTRPEAIGREGEPCRGAELARDEGTALSTDCALTLGPIEALTEGRVDLGRGLIASAGGGRGAGRFCVYQSGKGRAV